MYKGRTRFIGCADTTGSELPLEIQKLWMINNHIHEERRVSNTYKIHTGNSQHARVSLPGIPFSLPHSLSSYCLGFPGHWPDRPEERRGKHHRLPACQQLCTQCQPCGPAVDGVWQQRLQNAQEWTQSTAPFDFTQVKALIVEVVQQHMACQKVPLLCLKWFLSAVLGYFPCHLGCLLLSAAYCNNKKRKFLLNLVDR